MIQGLDCLDAFGDGPEKLYDTIFEYFKDVCKYLKNGTVEQDEEAQALFYDKEDDIEHLLSEADACGYGIGDGMQQLWDEVLEVTES